MEKNDPASAESLASPNVDKYEVLAKDHDKDACSEAGKMLAECRKVKEAAKNTERSTSSQTKLVPNFAHT